MNTNSRNYSDGIPDRISSDEELAGRIAEIFSALADPTRVRILAVLLEGEHNVGAISERVGLSHSAVSHQLRVLRQMRLVRGQRQGRQVFYILDDDHVAGLLYRVVDHVSHE